MTKRQMIEEIQKLRKPGDPLIPGDRRQMELRLESLLQRSTERKSK